MNCDRCGKNIVGEVHHVEDFDLCKDCYEKANFELGKTTTLRLGGVK